MKVQMDPTIKVNFKFYNQINIPFDVSSQDTLVEVRQFLQESTILYFYSNFHFEVSGKRVNEYQDIGSNGIIDGAIVNVLLDEFDERSARYHVRKIHEGFQNIGILQAILTQRGNKNSDREEFPFNGNVQKRLFYESYTDDLNQLINQKQQQQQQQQQQVIELSDVLKPQILQQFLLDSSSQEKQIKFVQSITFAGYNPPNQNRRLKGDLFYLLIKTIEGIEYYVTANPIGFFVNRSSRIQFDYEANNQYSLHDSLIELFKEISGIFKRELQSLQDSNEIYAQQINIFSSFKYNYVWLQKQVDNIQNEQDYGRAEQWCLDLHGLDITSVRDWNEELQVFRDLPRGDFVQKINRDKALVRVHGDFIESAVKGALAVVDHIIQPLNPMDPELQQVYVYNHIFFSFAMETPLNFRQETGLDATPTVSTTNCDFRNLKLLHRLDIPGLHVLNATLIDYKGRRVIAQSIIPGILNSDHSNCTQYGSIDEGKTIQKTNEFHQLMTKVCEHFHLDDSIDFLDGQNQVHTMAGGIEVKGILGSDKRMYLLDLLRLSIRDLNYEDNELHQCCVVRPELIQSYYFSKALQSIKQQGNTINNNNSNNNNSNNNNNNNNINNNDDQQDQMTRLQNNLYGILQGTNDKYRLKLNPALNTTIKLVQNQKLEQQAQQLKQVSDYLINQAIPALAQDLKHPDIQRHNQPLTISEIFHLHGVNMRYLGMVSKMIDSNEYSSVYLCLERTILCKSLKHVFRQAIRETSQQYLADVIAHLLNCVFSRFDDRQWLDSQYDNYNRKQQIKSNNNNKGNTDVQQEQAKKKKKKKNKSLNTEQKNNSQNQEQQQNPIRNKSNVQPNQSQYIKETPKSIWNKAIEIAQARYNHNFPSSYIEYQWFKFNFFKIACMRELCQQIGLVLSCSTFPISEGIRNQQLETRDDLSFQPHHIVTIQPVIKSIEVVSDDYRMNMELGQKFFGEEKPQEALECYLTAAQIIVNLFGTVHRDLANCFSKISAVYYKKMEYDAAIQFQRQSISIYIHLYGLDSSITAAQLTNLSFYYFGTKKYRQSFNYMLHALYLYNIVGGDGHQEVFNQFTNLSLLYSECGQHQSALNCLFESLDRCENIYSTAQEINGTNKIHNINLLKCAGYNQAIALEHSELGDVQKAVEFQTKAVHLLKQGYENNDYKVKEAQKLLDALVKALEDKKKNQLIGQNTNNSASGNNESKRAFGTNRQIKKSDQQQQQLQSDINEQDTQNNNNERDELMQRFKMAKLNAKQGFRRAQQGIDINKLIQVQSQFQNQNQNDKNNKKE